MEQLQASLDASVREVQDHERDKQSLAQRVSLLQAAHESASSQCGYGTAPGLETGTPRGPSSTSEERQQREREEEEERKREENLQEQLAVAQREATRLSELLSQVQEDTQAAHSQVSTLEQRVEQLEAEKAQICEEWEGKCQRHLEEKRQLRAQVGELQNSLADNSALLGAARRDLQDLRSRHLLEVYISLFLSLFSQVESISFLCCFISHVSTMQRDLKRMG